jgi:glycosyltransferase involved in cell wall biosynthesis
MKKVLIAHQSTIPHYRAPFYEAVNRLKPSWWDFGVIFDEDPERRRKLFVEPIDPTRFGFKTIPTRTVFLELLGRRLVYQPFFRQARRYDLIVLEDALHNLTYPLVRFWRSRGAAVAYWGHGKDQSIDKVKGWKRISEKLKRRFARNSEGYFAYTNGVRDILASHGIDSSKIFVLNNTIDIVAERSSYEPMIEKRNELRRAAGLSDRRVLLHVGRLNKWKRLDFLGESVRSLRTENPEYHLVVIGGGEQAFVDSLRQDLGEEGFTHCGVIVEKAPLAEWYALSDAYVHPGDVGLGVVQTLCYDLTPVVIDRPTHNTEYEYLDDNNSVIARADVSPAEYGLEIDRLCSNRELWEQYRARAWPSIKHLTIEGMARSFVNGVSEILRRTEREGKSNSV